MNLSFKIFLFASLFIVSSTFIVSSQSVVVPKPSEFVEPTINVNYAFVSSISYIILLFSLIIGLVIGISTSRILIRKFPRGSNLIVHCLFFVGSIVWLISMIFNFISQYSVSGNVYDKDMIEMGWPLIFPLILSGFLFFNILKKGNFFKKYHRFTNYTTGTLLTFIFASIVMFLINYISAFLMILAWGNISPISDYSLGVILIGFMFFMFGVILSYVLGIIGFFIDITDKN